jgi:hypothetical protein
MQCDRKIQRGVRSDLMTNERRVEPRRRRLAGFQSFGRICKAEWLIAECGEDFFTPY